VDARTAARLSLLAANNDPAYHDLAKRVVEGPRKAGAAEGDERPSGKKSVQQLAAEAKEAETRAGKLGEKISLKRLVYLDAADGMVEAYIHPGSQLGAIIHVATDQPDVVRELAKDLAMQVAAAAPIVVDRSFVPADYIAKESEIYRQQALEQGKKEAFVDKIVIGRLEKYYQDVVLSEQFFIKDNNTKVSDVLNEFRKKHQVKVDVIEFVRCKLGE
jgi:elongation factor Ts